jgi:UDP-glucuronate 4-epimerase
VAATLVTGGAGFIGSHLVERLLATGRRVVVVDSFDDFYDPAVKRRNLAGVKRHPGFSLVEADIRDEGAVREAADRFEVDEIVHLAARAGVRPSIEQPLLYQSVNGTGTTVMLEVARRRRVRNFLFGSSSSVYGESGAVPFREDARVDRPVSPYAATKKANEELCFTYHHLYGLPVTCLRFFTVYGPRQRPEMAIHKFARLILEGRPVPMYGDGTSSRDYTYVDDVVDGVVAALDRPQPYEIVNLGGSRTTALAELVRLLEARLGRDARVEQLPAQPGDVTITFADVSRAGRLFGYAPRVPIEAGLDRFVAWLKDPR